MKDWALGVARAIGAIPQGIVQKLEDGLGQLVSFFNEHDAFGGKGSMARLCAFAFMAVAVVLGVDAARIAVAHATDDKAQGMVKAIAILASVFVVNGCVALLLKSKPPGDSTTSGKESDAS